MVLLYMVTWIPSIYPLYVSIYTSTMEHMGMDIKWIITWIITWIIKWIINGWILWPSTPMINVSGCNWMIIGIWIGEWPHYNWDLSWFITPGIANPMAHLSRDGRRGWGWGMLFVWYNIHIIYTYIYIWYTYIYIYMIYIHIYIYQRTFAMAAMAIIQAEQELQTSRRQRVLQESKMRCWHWRRITGWWFGEFFIFPNSWDDDPIWLSYFSGGLKPPTS